MRKTNFFNLSKLDLISLKSILIFLIVILILNIIPGFIYITFIWLILYALKGKVQALQSLFMNFYLYFLNPGLWNYNMPFIPILRWILLIICLYIILRTIKISRNIPKWILFLTLWFIWTAIVSIFDSHLPLISLFKLLIFYFGMLSVVLGIKSTSKYYNWSNWMIAFYILLIILSLPLINSPLGYLRNNRGFQGIMNHPNTFGPILAIGIVILLVRLNFSNSIKQEKYILLIILVGFIELWMSQSRTALFSLFGAIIVLLLSKVVYSLKNRAFSLKRIIRLIIISILSYIIVLSNFDVIFIKLNEFIYKGNSTDIFDTSESILEREYQSFLYRPITGNGFGVNLDKDAQKTLSFNLSYPIEKRNIILALASETGFVGIVLFTFFIFTFIGFRKSTLIVSQDAIIVVILMINLGEMIFFSGNGMGMFIWFTLGYYKALKEGVTNESFISN